MSVARPRDHRPCDNCRRRKMRCLFASEDASNCMLCTSRSTDCTYVEDAPRKKRANPASSNKLSEDDRPRQRRKVSIESEMIRDYSHFKGQTLLKETLGHQNRQSSSVIGATGDFDSAITEWLAFDAKGVYSSFQDSSFLRRPNPSVLFLMRPDTEEESEQELSDLDAVEAIVAPYGSELVSLYFRIVHPSLPILHKKVFLEKHGRSYRESTPCGLGAVYLMALNWWLYSPTLSSKPKPDAARLEKIVLRMLFDVHKRPKISDLQGGLVLCQRPNINSWALTSHLVAMSQNLGINRDCTDWQVPDWERGVRKRVAWAVFMQDKWGALVYGRPSNIRLDDWDVRPLAASDFPETFKDDDDEEGSADIEIGKQTFIHMVSLTLILSEILDEFFTIKAIQRFDSLTSTLIRAKPIQIKLKQWYSMLPTALSVEETKPRRLSSVGYLHLAYFTAEATLHRAILRSHSNAVTELNMLLITRHAAAARLTAAVDFVKRLKQEHLQSFWYFSSKICLAIIGVFAGVLVATGTDREERDKHSALLAEYRWVLRISNSSADFMKYAVGVLDRNGQILDQVNDVAAIQDSSPSSAPPQSATSEDIAAQLEHPILSPIYADWNHVAAFDNMHHFDYSFP